jgi:hypothetical protein
MHFAVLPLWRFAHGNVQECPSFIRQGGHISTGCCPKGNPFDRSLKRF